MPQKATLAAPASSGSCGLSLRNSRAKFAIFDNLAEVQDTWNTLYQRSGASPYQSFSWFSAWFSEIGAQDARRACAIVIRDELGEPLILIPLVEYRRFGLTLIEFGGGKHSNLNVPIMSQEAIHRVDGAILAQLPQEIARLRHGPLVVRLLNMPSHWGGQRNPLVNDWAQRSPSDHHATRLNEGTTWKEALLSRHRRQRLDYNLRKIKALGPLRLVQSSKETDRDRIIEAFVRQKSEWCARKGIPDPFRNANFCRFVRSSADPKGQIDPAIELYALELDKEIIATLGAAVGEDSFSVMFMSMLHRSGAAKFSPGEVLLWEVIENIHARGFRHFDLGIGEAPYKARFCPDALPLFDVFVGRSFAGRVAAAGLKISASCKARLKRHPLLISVAGRIRHRLLG